MLREIIIGIGTAIFGVIVFLPLIKGVTHPKLSTVEVRNPYRNRMIERYGQERVEQIEKRRRERRGM